MKRKKLRGSVTSITLLILPIFLVGYLYLSHNHKKQGRARSRAKGSRTVSHRQKKIELSPWVYSGEPVTLEEPLLVGEIALGDSLQNLTAKYGEPYVPFGHKPSTAPVYPLNLDSEKLMPSIEMERESERAVFIKGRTLTVGGRQVVLEPGKDPRLGLGQESYRVTIQQKQGRKFFAPGTFDFYPLKSSFLVLAAGTAVGLPFALAAPELVEHPDFEPQSVMEVDEIPLGWTKAQLIASKGKADETDRRYFYFADTKVKIWDDVVVEVWGKELQQNGRSLLKFGDDRALAQDLLP